MVLRRRAGAAIHPKQLSSAVRLPSTAESVLPIRSDSVMPGGAAILANNAHLFVNKDVMDVVIEIYLTRLRIIHAYMRQSSSFNVKDSVGIIVIGHRTATSVFASDLRLWKLILALGNSRAQVRKEFAAVSQ
jgi:hypothetical protein